MSIVWTLPIETVPCEANPLPLPCEVIAGMSDEIHAYVRIAKERPTPEDEGGLWFIPGREDDTGKRVGSRHWWYLRSEEGRNEPGLPALRNIAK